MATEKRPSPRGNILIVDDNMSNLKSLQDILTFTGYSVHTATNGPLALQSMEDNVPDIVLLDYKMSGMDGIEVCRRIKSNPETGAIPVIFLSGHGDTELKIEAMEAGGIDYVTKPIQPAELLIKLENHLKVYRLQKRLTLQSLELQQEIAERKQAEEGLRNSEIFLSSIIEQTPFPTCIADKEGKAIRCNAAYSRFFHTSSKEMKEISYNLFQDASFQNHLAVIRDVYGRGKTGCFQICLEPHQLKTVEVTIFPITDDAGRVTNAILQYKDITAKLHMEEQLFINEKLTTIAGLATGVAHEINTPLSAILQSQQLLAMGLSPENPGSVDSAAAHGVDLKALHGYLEDSELTIFLEGIRSSALSASHIVQSLLEFSRPREGHFAQTDINLLMDKALLLSQSDYDMRKKYHMANIEIRKDYSQAALSANCVAVEIEQVILNLLKNSAASLAASEQKEKPMITLRSSTKADKAILEVEDNGPGIPDDAKQHIFDPFFTTRDVGTGLGLSISHGIIVDRHKGNFFLAPTSGQGARFVVELPLNHS